LLFGRWQTNFNFGKIYVMKQLLALAIICLMTNGLRAQKVNWQKINAMNPDKILLAGKRQPNKVLLVGSFHFGYPNLDGHKTDSSKFIDVLSAQRQKEIQELADVIKRFKPTRIYIESTRAAFHDSLYAEYLAGRYKPGRNEIYQVAYRVGKQMGLNKVYSVDDDDFISENYKRYTKLDSMANQSVPVDSVRDQYWGARYSKLYKTGDSIETTLTMLENFLLMAEPATLKRWHGNYFVQGFCTPGSDGPDVLSMWWYSRNLRIVNNILKTKPTAEDRILVLFGNGHVPIIKHCLEASPEFEVVELKSLLK
jgi:hypothetical protein